jgi:hypothetical protein
MKNSTKLGVFLVAILFAVVVRAEPLNFDVGYSKLHFKESGTATDDVDHVKFAVSRNNFEALASFNVRSAKGIYRGVSYEFTVPYILGLYYKPEIHLGAGINLFARVGITHASAEVKGTNSSLKVESSGNDLGFGLGMSMLSTKNTKVTLDYTSYYNRSGVAINGFSLTNTFLFP